MNSIFDFIIRIFISVPSALVIWVVSFLSFEQSFFNSTAIAFIGGASIYSGISMYLKYRLLKKHRLTYKEYKYIKKNLNEAKHKISRLNKALISIRHFPSIKQRIEFMRITRKIYSLTKKEPKRFYMAEHFFYSHLDSAVELAEKYVFLSNQPNKTEELVKSLNETRKTLDALKVAVEKDLLQVISDDIDQLHFEIDVAKKSINTIKESEMTDESRKINE